MWQLIIGQIFHPAPPALAWHRTDLHNRTLLAYSFFPFLSHWGAALLNIWGGLLTNTQPFTCISRKFASIFPALTLTALWDKHNRGNKGVAGADFAHVCWFWGLPKIVLVRLYWCQQSARSLELGMIYDTFLSRLTKFHIQMCGCVKSVQVHVHTT